MKVHSLGRWSAEPSSNGLVAAAWRRDRCSRMGTWNRQWIDTQACDSKWACVNHGLSVPSDDVHPDPGFYPPGDFSFFSVPGGYIVRVETWNVGSSLTGGYRLRMISRQMEYWPVIRTMPTGWNSMVLWMTDQRLDCPVVDMMKPYERLFMSTGQSWIFLVTSPWLWDRAKRWDSWCTKGKGKVNRCILDTSLLFYNLIPVAANDMKNEFGEEKTVGSGRSSILCNFSSLRI